MSCHNRKRKSGKKEGRLPASLLLCLSIQAEVWVGEWRHRMKYIIRTCMVLPFHDILTISTFNRFCTSPISRTFHCPTPLLLLAPPGLDALTTEAGGHGHGIR
ncbi:hypothetical protein BDQ12DRAFT_691541 [Crucibulum laeve]|uniref:Uncharacterized protein n=1 Tax=Crucibulum laeve TaxID=68775 RepID=A0A5C3LKG1_9AGAR|nr:hypothetical protein BDQ12DRAFT_691541 [Crucibulum laeve]